MDITERFLNYTKFDTQSAEDSESVPSTPKQLIFAEYLKKELESEGLEDVELDEKGYLYATLPSNIKEKVPTIGFISHYDTSPDCSGANIKPQIVRNYDGGEILLSEGIISSPKKFPELLHHMGAHHFDVEKFGCEWAYTMDGGDVGELEFENFNAASAKITIKGISVHPGYAKGKMVNANALAAEFAKMLPADETPETTEGYQGFYHLLGIQSNIEEAKMSYIIRDHDREIFEERKRFIQRCADRMNEIYGEGTVIYEVKDQYYNMKEKIDPQMHVIDVVLHAMQACEVAPKVRRIRGGTDGAQLSFKGLPCPNIFAGGVNFHGPYEFVSIQSMEKAMQVIVKIGEIVADFNN